MATISKKLELFKNNSVINWHEHVWMKKDETGKNVLNMEELHGLIQGADDNYMDTLICSLPITRGIATPEMCREANNFVYDAMQLYPGRILGMCYVDPGFGKEALDEIDRCVNELGMIGLKLYNQYTLDDPVQRPVLAKCAELNIPILIHAGYSIQCFPTQPNMSHSEQIARAAKAFPELTILMAHVTGGGDWLWQLRGIADCPNVLTDISGSVVDLGAVEETVRYLGADRVVFGTDGSIGGGVAKTLGAQISDQDKIKILAGAGLRRFLKEAK